ncbi:MAG: dienelactone hydrolase family protein [Polyangiales bacterium]
MSESRIDIPVDDGTTLGLHVEKPSGTPRAAIIVLQEIFGVNAHMRSVARRFADLGYLAVVPDLFHRQGAWFESGYQDIAPGAKRAQAITQDEIRADLRATHAHLAKELPGAKIGAVGFCMGGRQAWVANGILPLACAVSFYGSNIPGLGDLAEKQSGPIALIWGGEDHSINAEQRRAVAELLMEAKKPYVELNFGYATHGFFCDARSQYHPVAAKQAWAFVQAFVEAHLG